MKLYFFEEGIYTATICKDGINAGIYAADYNITTFDVTSQTIVTVELAPGEGFLLKLKNK